ITANCVARHCPEVTSIFAQPKFQQHGVVIEYLLLNLTDTEWLWRGESGITRVMRGYLGLHLALLTLKCIQRALGCAFLILCISAIYKFRDVIELHSDALVDLSFSLKQWAIDSVLQLNSSLREKLYKTSKFNFLGKSERRRIISSFRTGGVKAHPHINIKLVEVEKVRDKRDLTLRIASVFANELHQSNRLFDMNFCFVESSQIAERRGDVAMGDRFV